MPPYTYVLALSPDGRLVAGHNLSVLVILDARTGKELHRIEELRGYDLHTARLMRFSPDSKRLAITDSNQVIICDVAEGKVLANLRGVGRDRATPLSFSADSKLLAFGASLSVVLWDVQANKEVTRLATRQRVSTEATLSGDWKMLATWGDTSPPDHHRAIHLWDASSGEEMRSLKLDLPPVRAPVISPDDKQVLVIDISATVSVWDAATGRCTHRLAGQKGKPTVLAFSPDGKRIVLGTENSALQVWDAATGKRIGLFEGPSDGLFDIAFREDNKLLAAARSHEKVRLWKVPSGREITVPDGPEAVATALAFSPDGKVLLSGGTDGIRQWEIASFKEVRRTPGVSCVWGPLTPHLSPDGNFALWPNELDTTTVVTETSSGREITRLQCVAWPPPFVRFAAGSDLIAFLERDPAGEKDPLVVDLWSFQKRQVLRKRTLRNGSTDSPIALSPNDTVLAVGPSSTRPPAVPEVSLYDVSSAKEIAKIGVKDHDPRAMLFSPDGALLAMGCRDDVVRLWSTDNGKFVRELGGDRQWDFGYRIGAFSPDGRTLAIPSYSAREKVSKVRVWELASGKVRSELVDHPHWAVALAFAPDGRTLATSAPDSTILLWDMTGRAAFARGPQEKPGPAELARLWARLDDPDPAVAYRAMARLTAAQVETVGWFSSLLAADMREPLSDQEVERLIAKMEHESFQVREKALIALGKAGAEVWQALSEALKASPGPEKRRRLQELLDALPASAFPPGFLRARRALEVLEWLGTPEARRLLEVLAKGAPGARLTADARATLCSLRR
jgi:WD40 repeat protein